MEWWTALMLGLIGSLHCAGMCGPIALAVPSPKGSSLQFIGSRLVYNLGRISTYCLLGALFGFVGKSFAVFGWQRWVSLTIGILILIALFVSTKFSIAARVAKPINLLKGAFGNLLHRKTLSATFFLGLLNGFLPCGLVYAACAGAVATNHFVSGAGYMIAFGLGTIPMMLGVGLFGKKVQFFLRFKLQQLVPATLALVAVLLIFRGLGLGIPYLSPDLTQGNCCHH